MNNKQCSCNKDKAVNDLLKRVSNLEFEVESKEKENERLNNNWNELEKWVNNIMFTQGTYCINCMQVLNKIKKLKDSDKE